MSGLRRSEPRLKGPSSSRDGPGFPLLVAPRPLGMFEGQRSGRRIQPTSRLSSAIRAGCAWPVRLLPASQLNTHGTPNVFDARTNSFHLSRGLHASSRSTRPAASAHRSKRRNAWVSAPVSVIVSPLRYEVPVSQSFTTRRHRRAGAGVGCSPLLGGGDGRSPRPDSEQGNGNSRDEDCDVHRRPHTEERRNRKEPRDE